MWLKICAHSFLGSGMKWEGGPRGDSVSPSPDGIVGSSASRQMLHLSSAGLGTCALGTSQFLWPLHSAKTLFSCDPPEP